MAVSYTRTVKRIDIPELTAIVPVVESSQHEKVPPIVRMTGKIDFADKPTLWNFCNVDEECDNYEHIHSDDTRNENLK